MPLRRPSQLLRRTAVALGVVVALIVPAARADDIVRIANGVPEVQPLLRDVSIRRIEGGRLIYRERSGVERSIDLANVFYLATPGDPIFTAADLAFAQRDWDKAVDGYQKLLRAADAWKVQWAAPRLLVAADRANRFDAALAAYVATAHVDPAAAARSKPKLPARPSKYLDEAAKTLDAAANAARSDAEKQALLAWLVDVQQARGDQSAVDAAVERLATAAGAAAVPVATPPAVAPSVARTTPPAEAPTSGISPPSIAPPPSNVAPPSNVTPSPAPPSADVAAAMAVGADARLTQARAALAAGRYDEVASAIVAAGPMLVRSDQQAEALALAARAKSAAADASGDAGARRDAALAWMRLVAHFGAEPAAEPLVAEAMLDAARQQAAAGDAAAARALYEQLAAERPGTPAARQAEQRLSTLPGAGS